MKNMKLFLFFSFFLTGIYPQEIKYTINQGSYFFDEESIYYEDKIPFDEQGTVLTGSQNVLYVLGDYYSSTVHFSYFHNPIMVRDSSGQMHFAIIEDLVRDTLNSKIHDELNGSYTTSYYFDILKENSAAAYFNKEPYWINEWRTSVGETVFEDMYNTELVISDNYLFISQYDQQERVFLIMDETYDNGTYFFKVCLGKNILRFMNEAKDTFLNEFQNPGIYNIIIKKDGDYLKFYNDSVDNKPLAEFVGSNVISNKLMRDSLRCVASGEKIDLSKVNWPRHADGSSDFDDRIEPPSIHLSENNKTDNAMAGASEKAENASVEAAVPKPAPALGKTATVTENLRLRTNDTATAEVVTTLSAGTRVKVLAPGREDTIDGIASNWVQVRALGGAEDKDGNAIAAGTTGWLFGGYLSESEEATLPESAESERPDENTTSKEALPVVPIAAGVTVLTLLLGVALLAAKRRKGGKK